MFSAAELSSCLCFMGPNYLRSFPWPSPEEGYPHLISFTHQTLWRGRKGGSNVCRPNTEHGPLSPANTDTMIIPQSENSSFVYPVLFRRSNWVETGRRFFKAFPSELKLDSQLSEFVDCVRLRLGKVLRERAKWSQHRRAAKANSSDWLKHDSGHLMALRCRFQRAWHGAICRCRQDRHCESFPLTNLLLKSVIISLSAGRLEETGLGRCIFPSIGLRTKENEKSFILNGGNTRADEAVRTRVRT